MPRLAQAPTFCQNLDEIILRILNMFCLNRTLALSRQFETLAAARTGLHRLDHRPLSLLCTLEHGTVLGHTDHTRGDWGDRPDRVAACATDGQNLFSTGIVGWVFRHTNHVPASNPRPPPEFNHLTREAGGDGKSVPGRSDKRFFLKRSRHTIISVVEIVTIDALEHVLPYGPMIFFLPILLQDFILPEIHFDTSQNIVEALCFCVKNILREK